jgi:predicted Zn-ribbon and HTH transcriptional regulator
MVNRYSLSLDMLGYEEMKSPTSSQGAVIFRSLLDQSRPWGSPGRISKRRQTAGCITSIWQSDVFPCNTQRQARKLISGPQPGYKGPIIDFNRTQSRVVTGLLIGHNTLRRHLYVLELSNNPTCRKCGTEEETSVHIMSECEALASLRHTHPGSFFLQ